MTNNLFPRILLNPKAQVNESIKQKALPWLLVNHKKDQKHVKKNNQIS
jgi:hypothetical protein